MNDRDVARADQIERAIDKDVAGSLAVYSGNGAMTLQPDNMGEMMEFAKMMATGGPTIRATFRGNPGACLAICMQAGRWGMDPYAVANKAFEVNDQLSYEAQLIHAVVNTKAPLQSRLRPEFLGEGPARQCRIVGLLHGEEEPAEYTSPPIGDIKTKNSPLWASDPDQQLFYFSVRSWARRHVPEVLLGVYTPDELEAQNQHQGPDNAKLVSGERPKRGDYEEGNDEPQGEAEPDTAEAEPQTWEKVNPFGEYDGALPAERFVDWFFARLDELAEDMARDHIRNNIESALDCVAATTKDSRAFMLRLSDEGWPPESYAEKAEPETGGGEPSDEATTIPESLRRGEDGEPERWVKIAADARQAFANADSVGALETLGSTFHKQLSEANTPDEEMEAINQDFIFRRTELEKAAAQ